MKQIVITVPDDMPVWEIATYVRDVAEQVDQSYLSGHVGVDHHWTSEGRIS